MMPKVAFVIARIAAVSSKLRERAPRSWRYAISAASHLLATASSVNRRIRRRLPIRCCINTAMSTNRGGGALPRIIAIGPAAIALAELVLSTKIARSLLLS